MRPMTADHDPVEIAQAISDESVAEIIGTHVAELASAVGSFQDQCEWMATERDLPQLAVLLAALRDARAQLAQAEQDISPVIAELMGGQQVQCGDLKLERRKPKDRTQWDHGSLMQQLDVVSTVDPETGERLDGERRFERYRTMVNACIRPAWRTTALRSYGIQPDEFCTATPAPWKVDVHHVTDEGAGL